MVEKKTSSAALLQIFLVLGLSLAAIVLLLVLKPEGDLPGTASSSPEPKPHVSRPQADQARPDESPQASGLPALMPEQAPAKPVVQAAPAPDVPSEGDEFRVQVTAPGKIVLTEEQSEALRSTGSWGGTSSEGRAIIEKIPAEAFTADW